VFSVPEDKVAGVKVGSDVSVKLWSSDGTLGGKVREVGASADPVTRTYPVKVSLEADASVPLGATVYVTPKDLSLAGSPVIKLPTSALRKEGQGTAVWVLDTGTMTVRSQPVQIATADGNEAVIAAGLQPGLKVVSAGVHVLSPGQKVALYQERTSGAMGQATAGAAGHASAMSKLPAGTAQAAPMPAAK
jgi:multidrug efflux pump subunit AcrA (membrane-fusion protein)